MPISGPFKFCVGIWAWAAQLVPFWATIGLPIWVMPGHLGLVCPSRPLLGYMWVAQMGCSWARGYAWSAHLQTRTAESHLQCTSACKLHPFSICQCRYNVGKFAVFKDCKNCWDSVAALYSDWSTGLPQPPRLPSIWILLARQCWPTRLKQLSCRK